MNLNIKELVSLENAVLKTEDILKLTDVFQSSKYNNAIGQELLNKIIYLNAFIRETVNFLKTEDGYGGFVCFNDKHIDVISTEICSYCKQLCLILDDML